MPKRNYEDGGTGQLASCYFDKYVWQFWTNAFVNLDKYIFNWEKAFFNLDKYIFNLDKYILNLVRNIFKLDKYIVQFGQMERVSQGST